MSKTYITFTNSGPDVIEVSYMHMNRMRRFDVKPGRTKGGFPFPKGTWVRVYFQKKKYDPQTKKFKWKGATDSVDAWDYA